MNYTEAEIKVREATNDEQWGPHGSLSQEIAQLTLTYEHYTEVMGMLWKRMFQESKENWRSTYKVKNKIEFFYLFFLNKQMNKLKLKKILQKVADSA